MTLQRTRTAMARLGDTGALLVLGACGVGLAALLVTVAPMTTNAGVMLAFLAGIAAGNVAWSWITSIPFPWRQPARYTSRWRAALELIVGLGFGFLVVQGFEQFVEPILPTREVAYVGPNGGIFYEDIPGNVVVWLAVLWLAIVALNLARRLFRAVMPSPERNAA